MRIFQSTLFIWLVTFIAHLLVPLAAATEQKATNPISAHVIDTQSGKPGIGMPIILERQNNQTWEQLAEKQTDINGRIDNLYPENQPLRIGTYRLIFDTATYFNSKKQKTFFPKIEIIFQVDDAKTHYHIPLLLSPFGYSTYRGN